ncbi:MAG: exopolysaccharide transport family protein [Hyphomicrobium sp.]
MRAGPQSPPDQIDGSELIRGVMRKLPRIIIWSALAGCLTYAVSAMKAPSFESEAQLAIIAKGAGNPFDPKRDGGSPESVNVRMDKEAVNTHVRALLSPDLAATIAKDMNLATKVEFNNFLGSPDQLSAILRMAGIGAPRPGETEQDRVASEYFKRLEVYSPKESRFIGIRFTSNDADLAADIANRVAETYRENLASQSMAETEQVQQVLAPKIAQLKVEVSAADQDVERFKGEANIFKGGQQATGLNEQQLGELTAELIKAKAARSEADARLKSSREMVKVGSAEALPDVQKSPLIQNLIQQRVRLERQMSENAVANLPGHPVSRKLEADLAGLRRQISTEIAKIADGIDKEAKIAALREDSITKSLNEVKARVVTASPDGVKLRTLEATAKSKRGELERLEAQFEANRVKADSRSVGVEAQIITRARPSSVPVSPKKLANALLVSTATLLLALALVVTKGLLTGARRPAAPVPSFEGNQRRGPGGDRRAPELRADPNSALSAPSTAATVPNGATMPNLKGAVEPIIPLSGAGKVSSIDVVCQRLLTVAKGPQGFRTLVAAAGAALPPGPEVLALARALSAKDKAVLVIDWALSSPSIVASLGLNPDPGLAGLLDGRSTFEDTIRAVPGTDVHIITSGTSSAQMPAIGDAQKLNLLLDALDEAYEHIIVACPFEDGRQLFEATEGRFDAGITLSEPKRRASVVAESGAGELTEMFLGFEVAEIELIQFERPVASGSASGIGRIVRPNFGPAAPVSARL